MVWWISNPRIVYIAQSCCNLFDTPGYTWSSRGNYLRPVTAWMCERALHISIDSGICDTCRKKLSKGLWDVSEPTFSERDPPSPPSSQGHRIWSSLLYCFRSTILYVAVHVPFSKIFHCLPERFAASSVDYSVHPKKIIYISDGAALQYKNRKKIPEFSVTTKMTSESKPNSIFRPLYMEKGHVMVWAEQPSN